MEIPMGEIVNLRKFRKEAKKQDDAKRAAANRIVHGRSKAERETNSKNSDRLNNHVDGHRIETGDA
jgi:Domain of unknown function (DUF4169)